MLGSSRKFYSCNDLSRLQDSEADEQLPRFSSMQNLQFISARTELENSDDIYSESYTITTPHYSAIRAELFARLNTAFVELRELNVNYGEVPNYDYYTDEQLSHEILLRNFQLVLAWHGDSENLVQAYNYIRNISAENVREMIANYYETSLREQNLRVLEEITGLPSSMRPSQMVDSEQTRSEISSISVEIANEENSIDSDQAPLSLSLHPFTATSSEAGNEDAPFLFDNQCGIICGVLAGMVCCFLCGV